MDLIIAWSIASSRESSTSLTEISKQSSLNSEYSSPSRSRSRSQNIYILCYGGSKYVRTMPCNMRHVSTRGMTDAVYSMRCEHCEVVDNYIRLFGFLFRWCTGRKQRWRANPREPRDLSEKSPPLQICMFFHVAQVVRLWWNERMDLYEL